MLNGSKGFPETLVSNLGGMINTPRQKIGPSLDLTMDVNELIKACELLKTFGLKIPISFSDTATKEASSIHGGGDTRNKGASAKQVVVEGDTNYIKIGIGYQII